MTETVRREFDIPRPPAQVWHALTDSALLAEWMYPNDFQPRIGHRFTFRVPPNPNVGFDGLVVRCEVQICQPPGEVTPGHLAFSWSAGAISNSQVTFRLEPLGGETRVYFEHFGFDTEQPFGKQAFKGAEFGWAKMLKQLGTILDRYHSTQ